MILANTSQATSFFTLAEKTLKAKVADHEMDGNLDQANVNRGNGAIAITLAFP